MDWAGRARWINVFVSPLASATHKCIEIALHVATISSKQLLGGLVKVQLLVGVALLAGATIGAANVIEPNAPTYNWSGCYLGLEAGGGWGNSQFYYEYQAHPQSVGLAETNGVKTSGGLFGGTAGCSYQVSVVVLGLENDIAWTNVSGQASGKSVNTSSSTFQTKETWLDTLRGRLGIAWDRWQFYGTGGAAFGDEGKVVCTPVSGCGSASKGVTGWTAGAGAEYAFWGGWSVKIEYLHIDFGRQSFDSTPANPGWRIVPQDVTLRNDLVRVGVNYKFDVFSAFANGN
jgi:outer membrane immunogenic protein